MHKESLGFKLRNTISFFVLEGLYGILPKKRLGGYAYYKIPTRMNGKKLSCDLQVHDNMATRNLC